MTSQSTDPPHVTQIPGPAQVGSIDLPWLTFSGSPQESVSTFIQSVQRVAVQLSYMYEDSWIAHYAAGCFSDDSLLWYSDLDEETCNSWRKLRRALLQQYHHKDHSHDRASTQSIARPLDLPAAPGLPAAAPMRHTSPPPAPNTSTEFKGRLEVFLYKYPTTIGFLAYDRETSKFSIVRDVNQAQVISFPKLPKEIPFSILMEGLPVDTQYPYLGLLLRIAGVKELDVVAPVLLESKSYLGYDSMSSSYNAGKSPDGRNMPTITWTFRACSQSSTTPRDRRIAGTIGRRERASSAVWKHNENTNQLSMTWMMDNDTEGALAAVILDGEQASLQVRPVANWNNADLYPNETQVKLYFVPEELE